MNRAAPLPWKSVGPGPEPVGPGRDPPPTLLVLRQGGGGRFEGGKQSFATHLRGDAVGLKQPGDEVCLGVMLGDEDLGHGGLQAWLAVRTHEGYFPMTPATGLLALA